MDEDDNIVIPNLGKGPPPIVINNKVMKRSEILEGRKSRITSPAYPIETVKYNPINIYDDTEDVKTPTMPSTKQRKQLPTEEEVSLPSSVKNRVEKKKRIIPSSPPPLAIPPECKLEIPVPKVKTIGIIQKERSLPPSPVIHNTIEEPRPGDRENFSSLSEDEKYRRRLSYEEKFRIIRNAYRELEFPTITEDMSLERIRDIYEQQINRIVLSQSCTQYKFYLVVFLFAMEYACCNFLGLNASGFAMSQIRIMYRYEHLLAELGENSHFKAMAGWPPEVRLFLTVGFNMLFFIALKYGGKKVGLDEQTINGVYEGIEKLGNSFPNQKVQTDSNGIPEPPAADPMSQIGNMFTSFIGGGGGNFDLNGVINQVSGMFGGNKEMNKEEKEKCKSVPVSKPVKSKKDVNW